MNPMSIMAQAEKLGIPELQRSIQSGVVPAFIGVPLLQEKVKRQKQMQMGMAAQQPKRPSVAEQVGQEAQQATIADIMKDQALRMQGEMGQTGGISDSLPKPEGYAKGGPIAFNGEEDSYINDALRRRYKQDNYLPSSQGKTWAQYNKALVGAEDNKYVEPEFDPYARLRKAGSNIAEGLSKTLGYLYDTPTGPSGISYGGGDYSNVQSKPAPELRAQPTTTSVQPTTAPTQNVAPKTSFDFANPNQVATDVLANPARVNTDPDLWKWATEYKAQHPQQRRLAPAPTQTRTHTPYAQAAAPATQTQPAQEEERDLTLAEYMKQLRDATGENKGIDALRGRLSEREARLAKEEERAPWMALMQAGLATMAGTSPNALSNIGQGGMAGLQAYAHSMNKLEDAKDKSLDIQAKLEEAQRNEQLAAAKYGVESVQADKKAKATVKLEREKMAHDFKIHEMDNAARLQIENIQAGATRYSADARNAAYGDRVNDKGNITQYQYGQLVDKASDNVDKMIKDQMLSFTMSPEELSVYRQRMIDAQIQNMVGGMRGGMMPTQPVAANTGILPGYRMVHKQLSQQ